MSTATIIGAGPAGSTAAILLARRGWDVTLIEQQRFPRDKVCGECLSALAVEVLERHRLGPMLRKLGAVKLKRTSLVAVDGTEATVDLPRPMWGLSRVALDQALLAEATRTARGRCSRRGWRRWMRRRCNARCATWRRTG